MNEINFDFNRFSSAAFCKSELSLAGGLNGFHHSRPLAIRESGNQHVQKVE